MGYKWAPEKPALGAIGELPVTAGGPGSFPGTNHEILGLWILGGLFSLRSLGNTLGVLLRVIPGSVLGGPHNAGDQVQAHTHTHANPG